MNAATLAALLVKAAAKQQLRLSPFGGAFPAATDDKPRLLYVHIPFCLMLCPYCSFHKFRFHEPSARRYFALLRREILNVHALGYRFDAAYFGGGTTTVLPGELAETIDLIRSLFGIKEISCESDPVHLADLEDTRFDGRISRLSVGEQSFNDRHLRQMGRYEKFGSGAAQYEKVARAVGRFDALNVDMIYNYPDQTEAELLEDLHTLLCLRPEQITFYPLMYSPVLGVQLKKRWGALSFEREARFFGLIAKVLAGRYVQRSAWAWSLAGEGIIDEYVIERDEYVGLGSGAFSFLGGRLYANTFSLPEYARRIEAGLSGVTRAATFDGPAIARYRAMVELFGLKTPQKTLWPETALLKLAGAYDANGVTPKGALIASAMMREFYNGMDTIRETMRAPLTPEDGMIR
ncbi:MAG: coproporphyrinogen III oxidase family protein [Campylobacterales bacterium]